jgi:type IV pilus assembly protein PilQ
MTLERSSSAPIALVVAAKRKVTTLLAQLGCLSLALLLPTLLTAAEVSSLDKISYSSLPGNRVQVKLLMSAPVTQPPLSFTIDNPARIALDLANTRLNLPAKNQAIGVGGAQSVTAVEAGGRTRVVMNLVHPSPYSVKVEGNTVLVTLGEGETAPVAAAPAQLPPPVAQNAPRDPGANPTRAYSSRPGIENIDFRRGESNEGRIHITLSNPNVRYDIVEQGGKIFVDFDNAGLPERLDRKLDVRDFATPVTEVDTKPTGNGARIAITPSGTYEHLVYQSDNLVTVEVKPLTKEQEIALRKDKFTGERLSLNFQDIEVRAVLQLIADFTGKNLVASDGVNGNVTLRLKNVPWDQALNIILKSKGLGMRENGNVIMVAPQEEIAAREKLELETLKQLSELAPVRTEFVQINYAKAAEIATLIKAKENKLVSDRGNVTVDERTNTLLVQDTDDRLAEIRKVVSTLDIPVRQVLIESRLVIANQNFTKELGVKFGYGKRSGNTIVGGKLAGDLEVPEGANPAGFSINDAENYIVSLPTSSTPAGALGLAIGKVGSWLLQLELQALQAEGRGEVISNPRVITADQKEAVIEQGEEIPYEQSTSSGATSVSFKKAVLSLRVTPQITPDDRVMMDLKVNKDSRGQDTNAGPAINTQNVTTQVLVNNGETVVLGGIYQQTNTQDTRRVPFFSDVPYFGNLFKNNAAVRNKNELLIFVTPKILKDSLRVAQRQ